MNQQTLILDLDDTLIHCHKYFRKSKNEFATLLLDFFPFLTREEILQKQNEIDTKGIEKYGLDSSQYPRSLVQTYRFFCANYRRKIEEEEMEHIHQIGQKVFETEVQPLPYMYETLNELLDDGHSLYLFTGGDCTNQMRKIKQLGLDLYFKNKIFIFEHKDKYALQKILHFIKADKKSTWMIGNSLRTDIKPAIELGLNAIHIPSDIEWSYNIVDMDEEPGGTFAELESIKQLPEYMREYAFYTQAI
jgi:putative hydrolase of the HAD superfamily